MWNTIISTTSIIGLAVGSFLAGSIMKYGRRLTVMFANILAVLSSAICMLHSPIAIAAGRFPLGIAGGISNVVYGKIVFENMPDSLASKFGMLSIPVQSAKYTKQILEIPSISSHS